MLLILFFHSFSLVNSSILIGTFYSNIKFVPIGPSSNNIFCNSSNKIITPFLSMIGFTGKEYCNLNIYNTNNILYAKNSLTKSDKKLLINLIDNQYAYSFYTKEEEKMKSINQYVGFKDKNGKYFINNVISFDLEHNFFSVSNHMETSDINSLESFELYYSINESSTLYDMWCRSQREGTKEEIMHSRYVWSFFFNFFLTVFVLLYVLYIRYKIKNLDENVVENREWRLLKDDVFRLPPDSRIFARNLGWGMQLFLAFISTVFYTKFSARGSEISTIFDFYIKVFIFFAVFGGIFSSWILKTIKPKSLFNEYVHSSIRLPLILFSCLFIFIIATPFSSSFHFPIINSIAFLYMDFSAYFFGCFLGSFACYGIKLGNVSKNLRSLPPQEKVILGRHVGPYFSFYLLLSMIPQINILFSESWRSQGVITDFQPIFSIKYIFLILSLILSLIESMCLGIIMTTIKLKTEDWRWWWSSFWVCGMVGLEYIIYSFLFCLFVIRPSGIESLLLFTLGNAIIGLALSQIFGSFSLIGSFIFLKQIYKNIISFNVIPHRSHSKHAPFSHNRDELNEQQKLLLETL